VHCTKVAGRDGLKKSSLETYKVCQRLSVQQHPLMMST